MGTYEIIIASIPDREKCVAEIWFDGSMLAEVNHETDEFIVEFFCDMKSKYRLDDVIESLSIARSKL